MSTFNATSSTHSPCPRSYAVPLGFLALDWYSAGAMFAQFDAARHAWQAAEDEKERIVKQAIEDAKLEKWFYNKFYESMDSVGSFFYSSTSELAIEDVN